MYSPPPLLPAHLPCKSSHTNYPMIKLLLALILSSLDLCGPTIRPPGGLAPIAHRTILISVEPLSGIWRASVIYHTVVRPTLFYGCETWPFKSSHRHSYMPARMHTRTHTNHTLLLSCLGLRAPLRRPPGGREDGAAGKLRRRNCRGRSAESRSIWNSSSSSLLASSFTLSCTASSRFSSTHFLRFNDSVECGL